MVVSDQVVRHFNLPSTHNNAFHSFTLLVFSRYKIALYKNHTQPKPIIRHPDKHDNDEWEIYEGFQFS